MSNYNPFNLQGKTILITGASSGIGKATAIACAAMGATLVITGRDKTRLQETYELLAGNGHLQLIADLASSSSLEQLAAEMPPLHGLVYAAGISMRAPLKFIKEEELNILHHINFSAPVMLTRHLHKNKKLLPDSSLVYISSVAANYASLGHIMYMSSKAALNAFVKGLALELAPRGIRANAILPGMITTSLSPVISEEQKQLDLANYPLGRYGRPDEVANAAIYLLSDAAAWITGSMHTIDGGLTLR